MLSVSEVGLADSASSAAAYVNVHLSCRMQAQLSALSQAACQVMSKQDVAQALGCLQTL